MTDYAFETVPIEKLVEPPGTPKVYAFRIYHKGHLVAESPLVVHDIDAAIETFTTVVHQTNGASPGLLIDILPLLLQVKRAIANTYVGVLLSLDDSRTATSGPADEPTLAEAVGSN